MEVVIKIPEDDYKRIVKYGMTVFGSDEDIALLEGALENGTPLPKGHGRLIDADALASEYSEFSLPEYIIEPYINAPTIIEADKEVDE